VSAPAADVVIDAGLATRLLAEQAPRWAGLPVELAAQGWDNVVLRLGENLAVRMPCRASVVGRARAEALWAPDVAEGLALPLPVPLFVGEPGEGYPYPWLVVPWFEGTVAAQLSQERRDAYAEQLAGFLVGFHRLAPLQAPASAFRGVAVAERLQRWHEALATVPADVRGALAADMDRAAAARPWERPARWLHGDPHPFNLVAQVRGEGARLTAALDLSDLCAGDPASDLGIAQAQFSAEGARRFRAAYGRGAAWADADLWDRAAGWRAHFIALMHADPGPLGRVARQAVDAARD